MRTVKSEIRISKSETNSNIVKDEKPKLYDLEDRTFCFARDVRVFVGQLPRTLGNIEDGRQVIRSSGSVGANYREANEAISKKDFLLRIRICRKEAKESQYWLRLLNEHTSLMLKPVGIALAQEATELMMIFGAILRKAK